MVIQTWHFTKSAHRNAAQNLSMLKKLSPIFCQKKSNIECTLVYIDVIYHDPKLPQVFLWWWSSFSGKAKRQTKFPTYLSSSSWPLFYFLFPRFCDNSIVSGRNLSHNGAKSFWRSIFSFVLLHFHNIFLQFSILFWSVHFINISWNRNCKKL